MTTWSQAVHSSMVSSVSYDTETAEMTVAFKGGKRGIYSGVPESLALDLANAPSVGQFLNSEIKGVYQFRYG